MIYNETHSTDAAFHFSAEEYFMHKFEADEPVLMIWQADKCVMLGNYQIADAEIDVPYAQDNGIQIVRRSSGGGTIFTDLGTLLCTVILPYTAGQDTRELAQETLAAPIIGALSKIGISAKAEGRNDVLVNGKKISGMAQYVRNGKLCSHCSLLYDTDLDLLTRVLRVDSAKIESKAIRSIRSRVANLSEYMTSSCSTREFMELLKQKLFEAQPVRAYVPDDRDFAEIFRIYSEKYGNPSWTFGRTPKFSFHNSNRFAGGKAEVYLDVVKGEIASCRVRGDFLGVAPIRALEEQIERKAYRYQDLRDTLDKLDLRPYLGDITAEQLLSCMFNEAR